MGSSIGTLIGTPISTPYATLLALPLALMASPQATWSPLPASSGAIYVVSENMVLHMMCGMRKKTSNAELCKTTAYTTGNQLFRGFQGLIDVLTFGCHGLSALVLRCSYISSL